MDAQEIRMRCLEVAQTATRTAQPCPPETIVGWASKFESYVVGTPEKPAKEPKTPKVAA